jgi:membrane complex biogenesis BtpA family protein
MARRLFEDLGKRRVIIGMVHLDPMPGTPFYEEGSFEETLENALRDAKALEQGGAAGCLVQTVDRSYPTGEKVDYARVIGVAHIVRAIAQETKPEFQIGVQIMANALKASLAVAKTSGGSFLRCYALVGQTLSGWGMIEARPESFFRYRRYIGADSVKIIAEVDGMHFKWYGEERPVHEVARLARYAGANAVEVAHADEDQNLRQIQDIKAHLPDLPVILGGHTNHENVARRLAHADGAFVGSAFQPGGRTGPVDAALVREYMSIVQSLD